MLSQDLGHANTVLPSTKASPALATVLKRTASWRSSHVVQTGLRSGKVNLEKMRRCKSLNEGDDPYVTNVTLESITDLENRKDNETSAISQLLPQEVLKQVLCRNLKTIFLSILFKSLTNNGMGVKTLDKTAKILKESWSITMKYRFCRLFPTTGSLVCFMVNERKRFHHVLRDKILQDSKK